MCVDIFAVNKAMSVPFLHEQLWFHGDHGALTATVVCDAFLKNQSPSSIERLRIQFPHYVDPTSIQILSKHPKKSFRDEFEEDKYGWFADCEYDWQSTEVTFRPKLENPRSSHPELHGKLLDGSFAPNGLVPPASAHGRNYLEFMRGSDLTALDLLLNEPLQPGTTGWIRLRFLPSSWPPKSLITPFGHPGYLRPPSEFLTRIEIISPLQLRRSISKRLSAEHLEWYQDVVTDGWKAAETLLRIEDHRISVVYNSSLHVVNVSTTLNVAVAGPQPCSTNGQALTALHLGTGSLRNEARDLVTIANRITRHCQYLLGQPVPVYPTRDHLMNRFGASDHEAIGVLLDKMVEARALEIKENDKNKFQLPPDGELHRRLLALRKMVTFPDVGEPLLSEIRDLHPFHISFDFRWRSFTSDQIERANVLELFIDRLIELKRQQHGKRSAVLCSCWDYSKRRAASDTCKSNPQLSETARKLKENLTNHSAFHPIQVNNPRTDADLAGELESALSKLTSNDLFLFWFVGHAEVGKETNELLLTMCEDGALSWSGVLKILEKYKEIPTIVVLDCCHAGQAQATNLTGLGDFLLWPTTTAGLGDGGLFGDEVDFVSRNFTAIAADLLLNSEGRTMTFKELLSEAQEAAIHNEPAPPLQNGFANERHICSIELSQQAKFDYLLPTIL